MTENLPPAPATAPTEATTTVVGRKIASASTWALRLLVLGAALWVVLWVLREGWPLVFPLLLAILLTAVLWPVTQLLRRVMPNALAALLSMLALLGAIVGVFAAIIPTVADQSEELVASANAGLDRVQEFITGPPLNLGDDQLGDLIDQGITRLQDNAQAIAFGVLGGLSSVGSGVVTALLVLVLTFFCLNDGDRLLPWSRRWLDERTWRHAEALGHRLWTVVRGYILSQAAVALADAILIGVGLAILGIPFALPLAVTIFFAAFIPIVGAVVTGLLAVLVALVTGGWVDALIALGIVLVVQQLEGNVLQPLLVGHTLALHPAVVIGAVTIGATLFGITGAFLAVPVAAILAVILRYIRHTLHPDEPETPAPGGERTRRRVEEHAAREESALKAEGAS